LLVALPVECYTYTPYNSKLNAMRYLIMLFISGLLIAPACRKDAVVVPVTPPPKDTTNNSIDTVNQVFPFGKAQMLKNNVFWLGTFKARYESYAPVGRFYLYSDYFSSVSMQDIFIIEDIPCKPGIFPLERTKAAVDYYNFIPECLFTIVLEGDQHLGNYEIDTTRNDHFVEVLRYDSVQHIVEGRFQMFLVKTNSSNWMNPPQAINITEGKFNLKLENP
jgi:hypothetical protein